MRSWGFEKGKGEKKEKASGYFGQARHGLIIASKNSWLIPHPPDLTLSRRCGTSLSLNKERGHRNYLSLGVESLVKVEGLAAGDLGIILLNPGGELGLDGEVAGAAGLIAALEDEEELTHTQLVVTAAAFFELVTAGIVSLETEEAANLSSEIHAGSVDGAAEVGDVGIAFVPTGGGFFEPDGHGKSRVVVSRVATANDVVVAVFQVVVVSAAGERLGGEGANRKKSAGTTSRGALVTIGLGGDGWSGGGSGWRRSDG